MIPTLRRIRRKLWEHQKVPGSVEHWCINESALRIRRAERRMIPGVPPRGTWFNAGFVE